MNTPIIDLPFPMETHGTLAEKALRVAPEMVLQIASGLDEPQEIAARYGYDAEQFKALSEWTPFVQEVAKTRAELEASGFSFTLDSRLKAKELSNALFIRAMSNDATFSQILDAFKAFTEFGDLKPKPAVSPTAPNGSPTGFSISIVLNTDPRPPHGHPNSTPRPGKVIDLTVEEPPREVMGTENPFTINSE